MPGSPRPPNSYLISFGFDPFINQSWEPLLWYFLWTNFLCFGFFFFFAFRNCFQSLFNFYWSIVEVNLFTKQKLADLEIRSMPFEWLKRVGLRSIRVWWNSSFFPFIFLYSLKQFLLPFVLSLGSSNACPLTIKGNFLDLFSPFPGAVRWQLSPTGWTHGWLQVQVSLQQWPTCWRRPEQDFPTCIGCCVLLPAFWSSAPWFFLSIPKPGAPASSWSCQSPLPCPVSWR